MHGCKGVCSRIETKRPYGNPYTTHVLCRRCSAWLKRTDLVNMRCPCCKGITKQMSKRKRLSKIFQ